MAGEYQFPVQAQPDQAKVQALIRWCWQHPGWVKIVHACVEWTDRTKMPFQWHQIRQLQSDLDLLVVAGILTKVPRMGYELSNYLEIRMALVSYLTEVARMQQVASSIPSPGSMPQPPAGAPPDLFGGIVGYEPVKRLFLMSLNAKRPVHLLMVGAPSSGKSLFLEAVEQLPGAVLRFGDSITRAGLRRLMMEDQPSFLLVDEIDKMSSDESPALLELMERGKVSVLKYTENAQVDSPVRVYAAANDIRKMRPELVSRFQRIQLRPYTPEEFVRVAYHYLASRGTDEPIARVIAEGLAQKSCDIRDARRISDLASTIEDAQWLIAQVGTTQGV